MIDRTGRVAALFFMELRSLLRDRRTVVLSIVIPVAVMPVMLFASRWMESRRQQTLEARESSYTVTGPRADEVRHLVERARAVAASPGSNEIQRPLRLKEVRGLDDPATALVRESLDVYIEGTTYSAASARAGTRVAEARDGRGSRRASSEPGRPAEPGNRRPRANRDRAQAIDVDDDTGAPPPDLLTISIVFRSDRDSSRRAAQQLATRLREVRRVQRDELLKTAGFVTAPADLLAVKIFDLAAESQVAGLTLGRLVTLLLLFFLLSGGAVVAQDTLAGEKERGTLETLLTTAITRREIVTAKVLLVLVVAVTITAIQVVNLLVYVGFGLIPTTRNLAAAITPGMAAGLLVFLLPLAALVAGVLVLVSGYARSYREAQLYFLPVMLLGAVPAMAAFLPAVSLRSIIALVPVANISVGVKELLVGRVDWLMMPVAWLVTAGAAALAIRSAAQLLSTERLIVPATSAPAARADVRPGQVVVWFAVMWAIMLVVSLNAGAAFDIRGQLLVNLVGIFLGGSLLFIRRHRLDARKVLSLNVPHPAVWVAVLAGIPSGLITGIGIFRLSQIFLPVPKEMLESFGQYLMPEAIPLWQLLPLMTILPGICEEVAFRGVLLHGLRRRFSVPVSIAIASLAFGLFHVSLFRIPQTAYLGVLLATVTVLSGSIFPAMVWHAGSNALALTSERFGFALGRFEPATYGAAAGVLVVCFWILWRTRRGPTAGPPRRASGTLAMGLMAGILGLQPAEPLAEGRAALARGDVPAAVAAAERVLRRDPLAEDAVLLKVEALATAMDWESALGAYDAFITAGGPERATLLRFVGLGYLRETVAFYPSLRHNALGRLACSGDRDALLELRRDKVPTRPDDVEALLFKARLGDVEALIALRGVSLAGAPGLRASALQALQQLRDRGAERAVQAALGQPDAFLRIAGARAARVLGLEAAMPELKALVMDRHPQVAAEALASLAALGHAESLERVRALSNSPNVDIRVAALSALALRAPSPQVLDGLSAAARVRTGTAWGLAVELLIPRDLARATAAIRDALTDANPGTRVQALRLAAAVPMEDPGDLARLRGLLRDHNLFVRMEAATVAVGQSTMCGG